MIVDFKTSRKYLCGLALTVLTSALFNSGCGDIRKVSVEPIEIEIPFEIVDILDPLPLPVMMGHITDLDLNDKLTYGYAATVDGYLLHLKDDKWEVVQVQGDGELFDLYSVIFDKSYSKGLVSGWTLYELDDSSWTSHGQENADLAFQDFTFDGQFARGFATSYTNKLYSIENGKVEDSENFDSVRQLMRIQMNPNLTSGYVTGNYGFIREYSRGRWIHVPEIQSTNDLLALKLNTDCTEGWLMGDEGILWHLVDEHWTEYPRIFDYGTLGWPELREHFHSRADICFDNKMNRGWLVDASGRILIYENKEWHKAVLMSSSDNWLVNELTFDRIDCDKKCKTAWAGGEFLVKLQSLDAPSYRVKKQRNNSKFDVVIRTNYPVVGMSLNSNDKWETSIRSDSLEVILKPGLPIEEGGFQPITINVNHLVKRDTVECEIQITFD
jgi:hypothetical protein